MWSMHSFEPMTSSHHKPHQWGKAHGISTFPLHTPILSLALRRFILALYSQKNPIACLMSFIIVVPFTHLFCLPKYTSLSFSSLPHILASFSLHRSSSDLSSLLHSSGLRWESCPRTSAQSSPGSRLCQKNLYTLLLHLFSSMPEFLRELKSTAVLLMKARKGKCNLCPYHDVLTKKRYTAPRESTRRNSHCTRNMWLILYWIQLSVTIDFFLQLRTESLL